MKHHLNGESLGTLHPWTMDAVPCGMKLYTETEPSFGEGYLALSCMLMGENRTLLGWAMTLSVHLLGGPL